MSRAVRCTECNWTFDLSEDPDALAEDGQVICSSCIEHILYQDATEFVQEREEWERQYQGPGG